jgi:hypothetical protein
LTGKILHLLSDNGKPFSGDSCPRRFNGGIQSQQVGLIGKRFNDSDNFLNDLAAVTPPLGCFSCGLHEFRSIRRQLRSAIHVARDLISHLHLMSHIQ